MTAAIERLTVGQVIRWNAVDEVVPGVGGVVVPGAAGDGGGFGGEAVAQGLVEEELAEGVGELVVLTLGRRAGAAVAGQDRACCRSWR